MLRCQLPFRGRCGYSFRASSRVKVQQRPRSRLRTSYAQRVFATERNAGSVSTVDKKEMDDGSKDGKGRSVSPKSRMKAVAEKVSAARELARRLAEEKEAAVKTGKGYSEKILKSTEAAATQAAILAAEADNLNRALELADAGKKKARDAELQYLKKINKELKSMVLEFASDKMAAERRLAELMEEVKTEVVAEEEEVIVVEPLVVEEPPPVEVIEVEEVGEAEKEAKKALAAGRAIFTIPTKPSLGKDVRMFYNRLAGPLPEGCALTLKYGMNKWESIQTIKMDTSEELSSVDGEWWEARMKLDDLLYRLDFVVVDEVSGLVDNNDTKDFEMPLKKPMTKGQILEKRLVMFEENEERRNKEFESVIAEMMKEAMARGDKAAEEAKEKTMAAWEEELQMKVDAVVGERRTQAIKSLGNEETVQTGQLGWFGDMTPGSKALLAYNTETGPLKDSAAVRLHLGTDNWYQEAVSVIELRRLSEKEVKEHRVEEKCGSGIWWGVELDVPEMAAVLNYVFDDGKNVKWDNNDNKDYTTAVVNPLSHDELIELKKSQIRKDLEEELQRRVDAAAQAARNRITTRVETKIRRWRAQWKYLYTNPIRVQAGQNVDICYRPDLTVLRGRPEVYAHVGFNHWKHPKHFPPLKLEPMISNSIGFETASLQVPPDAHDMDIVFSDSPEIHSGFVDNNQGFNYHFAVSGSSIAAQPLKIVHVTVEMAPIAKVGGLADVVTALGRAVQEEGHVVEVVMPKYDCIDYDQVDNLNPKQSFHFAGSHVQIWSGQVEDLDVTFIEPDNGFFWIGRIYGALNDAQRFDFFCGAAAEYLRIFNISPDLVHCHDWQTAPVVWSDLVGAKTMFTIHNLNYGVDLISRAMQAATVATTVSPTYATEISGSPAIESNFHKLYGVLNGIDTDIWDPSRDRFLPITFSTDNLVEGKAAARKELRSRLNLAQIDVPVVGVVTRLTPQKGIHLIKHAAWRTLERGGQFVLLGSAPDPRIQHEFNQLAADLRNQYPDRASLLFAYDEPLSHLIYAGCDIFLVPSIFEPCGLTQMIAMRYGTVPVVRKTGGLNDTVFDVDTDGERAQRRGLVPNGFNFEGADEMGMDYALNRALGMFFSDRDFWNELSANAMKQDWSWSLPALDYLQLYYKALSS